jgi:hypothetical protein
MFAAATTVVHVMFCFNKFVPMRQCMTIVQGFPGWNHDTHPKTVQNTVAQNETTKS